MLDNNFNIFPVGKDKTIYQKTHLTTDHENNTFTVSIEGLTNGFTAQQFKFKGSFISLKGATQIAMNDVMMNTTFKMENQTLADGRRVPAFSVADFSLIFPDDSIGILIQGNIETKVSKSFK